MRHLGRLVLKTVTTMPTNPQDGELYFDATERRMKVYSAAISQWITSNNVVDYSNNQNATVLTLYPPGISQIVTVGTLLAPTAEIGGGAARTYYDCSNVSNIRLITQVSVAVLNSTMKAEYSLNDGTTWAQLYPSFSTATSGYKKLSWVAIPAAAKADILIRTTFTVTTVAGTLGTQGITIQLK
jgi:hypothetical protein